MNRQTGAALITAMVLVAMVVVMMSELMFSQWKAGRRYAAVLLDEQALSYAYGGEAWVKRVLYDDFQDDPSVDHLGENWKTTLSLPFEGGGITGSVEDLQGRFNVNSLLDASGNAVQERVDVFNRLLTNLNIDVRVTNQLLDWMDQDLNERFPDGAEDDAYSRRTPPFRALNSFITDVSELAQLDGLSAAELRRLRPHITALPGAPTLNLNTLTDQVYLALSPQHTQATYETYVARRESAPFYDVSAWPDTSLEDVLTSVGVTSQFFSLSLDVVLGERQVRLYSVLERTGGGHVFVRLRYLNPTFLIEP